MADLQDPPVIEPNTRHKYSNHGFAVLGVAIEAITYEAYRTWIKREIVDAASLEETEPDMPMPAGVPFARGHSADLLLGKRLVIPGDYSENAVTPAGGFVSTASDLAKYFAQLAPNAARSVLSAASRREMTRRHWRNPHSSIERYYGLGVMSGNTEGWEWFGHGDCGGLRREARHRKKCATGRGGGGTHGAPPIWFPSATSCWSPIRGSSGRYSTPPR